MKSIFTTPFIVFLSLMILLIIGMGFNLYNFQNKITEHKTEIFIDTNKINNFKVLYNQPDVILSDEFILEENLGNGWIIFSYNDMIFLYHSTVTGNRASESLTRIK